MPEPSSPAPLSPDQLGFETIVYEKAPPRATITLNRPDVLNAFDFRMLREIARACEDVSWDDHDSLAAEHAAFVASVMDGASVLVDAAVGKRALSAALAVGESMRVSRERMTAAGLIREG